MRSAPSGGAPAPVFSELLRSVTVLEPTTGDDAGIDRPRMGHTACARPNSDGLLALCGIDETSSSVAAAFSANRSPSLAGDGCVGPLALLRDAALAARTFLVPGFACFSRAAGEEDGARFF